MSPTKKSQSLPQSDGTTSTNYGATFEISSTAITVIRASKQYKEFKIWMNYKEYEPWDDIVMELDNKIICVQLKHNEKFDKKKFNVCLMQRKAILEKYPSRANDIIFVYFTTALDDTSVGKIYPAVSTVPDFLKLVLTSHENIYCDNIADGVTYFCMNQNNIATATEDIKQALLESIGQNLSNDQINDIRVKFLDYLEKRYQRHINGTDPLTKQEICSHLSYAILSKLKVDFKPTDAKINISNNLSQIMELSPLIVFNHRWSSSFRENIWHHLTSYLEQNISKKHLKSSKLDQLWMEGKLHMPIISLNKETDKVILRALEIANFEPQVLILRPRIFKIRESQEVITLLQNLNAEDTTIDVITGGDQKSLEENQESFKYVNVDLNDIRTTKVTLHPDSFYKVIKDYFKTENTFLKRIIETHDEYHYINDSNMVADIPMPALFAAIEVKNINIKIIEYLIRLGAEVNASIVDGYRPVYFAVKVNRPDILKLLLEKNANPDPADKYGMRPLFYACKENKSEMVRLLVEYGSDRNNSDVNGVRPLFMAYDNKNFEIMEILLTGFDKPNAANTEGSHILHKAADDGNVDCLKCILKCCPDVKKFMNGDVNGESPLNIAERKGFHEFSSILKKLTNW